MHEKRLFRDARLSFFPKRSLFFGTTHDIGTLDNYSTFSSFEKKERLHCVKYSVDFSFQNGHCFSEQLTTLEHRTITQLFAENKILEKERHDSEEPVVCLNKQSVHA